MTAASGSGAICPRCGYQNGEGAERCLRCHQILAVHLGCSCHSAKCLRSTGADAPDQWPHPQAKSPGRDGNEADAR